jgi:DNA-binding response OmpR family regulator
MDIIVASNNLFRRELSSYVLSEASYQVHEASTTSNLLEVLHEQPAALILLDSGLDQALSLLIDRIRELSNAPILWLHNKSGDHETAVALAEDGALHWPYNPNELVRRVHGLISGTDQERVVG